MYYVAYAKNLSRRRKGTDNKSVILYRYTHIDVITIHRTSVKTSGAAGGASSRVLKIEIRYISNLHLAYIFFDILFSLVWNLYYLLFLSCKVSKYNFSFLCETIGAPRTYIHTFTYESVDVLQ